MCNVLTICDIMNSQIFSCARPLSVRKLHISSVLNTAKPTAQIDSIIRVNHAGELGADRIYAGQMAVLGNTKVGPLIQHMWDQEKVHKAAFEELIVKHRVRPTALVPIWNVAGFVLGAGTALLGEKAAMACTVAVESVIVDHYNDQLRELMAEPDKNKELMQTIQKFRDDEQEHHDHGIDHGAEQAPFYRALSEIIKFGCKTAIALSKGLFTQRNQYYIATNRSYCTSSKAIKWDLHASVVLERKPVVLKSLCEKERKVLQLFSQMEAEKSFKSDHEIKAEEDLIRAEKVKIDPKLLDLDAILQQSAHEFEEAANKEFEVFQPAPIFTIDDKKNNVKSVNRKLTSHLLLLVKKRMWDKEFWLLPHGMHKDSETMRETAERVLHETCGDKLKVLFLGNAPCGFYKWTYPKKFRTKSLGLKIFFFKAVYFSGQVNLQADDVSNYQWATRSDLKKLICSEEYLRSISKFLIKDEDDHDSGVLEPNVDIELTNAEQTI